LMVAAKNTEHSCSTREMQTPAAAESPAVNDVSHMSTFCPAQHPLRLTMDCQRFVQGCVAKSGDVLREKIALIPTQKSAMTADIGCTMRALVSNTVAQENANLQSGSIVKTKKHRIRSSSVPDVWRRPNSASHERNWGFTKKTGVMPVTVRPIERFRHLVRNIVRIMRVLIVLRLSRPCRHGAITESEWSLAIDDEFQAFEQRKSRRCARGGWLVRFSKPLVRDPSTI